MQGSKRRIVLPQRGFNLCAKAFHRAKDKDADNPFDGGCQPARRRCALRPSSYDDRCNLSSRETTLLCVTVPFSTAVVSRFLFSFSALLGIKSSMPVPPVCIIRSSPAISTMVVPE